MPSAPSSAKRFLPHAVVATFVVMVLPALSVSVIHTSSRPWLVVLTVLLAMAMSVAGASVGAAIWKRRPGSKDIVFGDLLLWGWLRRMRAERRLDQAQKILGLNAAGSDGRDLSRDRRCEVLRQLGALLEARDAYTHGHTRRVTRHSERVAREMDLSPAEVAKVRTAAATHDVGKVYTPREVLTKTGRLTDAEYAIVKQHPGDGAAMVAEIGDPEITAMVRHHHERLDGTGYPDGLAADDIPLGARIIAVADTFDAITSDRPYRAACKHKKALDVLSQEAGTQLDPVAVAAFLRYYSGKRSVAWSALFIDAPPRLISWAGGLFQGAGAGIAPVGQAIAAVGAAALIGTTLGGPAPATAEADSAAAGHSGRPIRTPVDAGTGAPTRAERGHGTGSHPRAGLRRAPLKRARARRPDASGPATGKHPYVRPPATKIKSPAAPSGGSGGNGNGGQKDKPPKAQPPQAQPPKAKPPKPPKPVKLPPVKPPTPAPPHVNPPKLKLPKPAK
jgi:HD-GYP domain-containing protein (c-di-GMP phosphodiesterase class II)